MSDTDTVPNAAPSGQRPADKAPARSFLNQLMEADAACAGGLIGYLERARRLLKAAQMSTNPWAQEERSNMQKNIFVQTKF